MPDLKTLQDLKARVDAASGDDKRILDRLDRSGDCWLWTGNLDHSRRGRVWRNGRLMIHHRAVWEILVGPIPAGAFLCHHCDNPQCANPAHLYVGNSKTNVADMISRGRHWLQVDNKRAKEIGAALGGSNTWARGSLNPKARLSPAEVDRIRQSTTRTKLLANQYGVDRRTIQRIRGGTAWS